MADDIVSLLNHENVDKVHGVGHDWRSYLLSRLANYHSVRFYSYSFLGVGYMPPNIVFDLDRANAELKREVGYDTFGFLEFFLEDDAPALLREHVSTVPRFENSSEIGRRSSSTLSTPSSIPQIPRCGSSIWGQLVQ